MPRKTNSNRLPNSKLRIIGGLWRSRLIEFPAVNDVRPTPDRVRETLFNWLGPSLEGRRCLDLFAGSGALGLEALSRGAAMVQFVDASPALCAALQGNLAMLGKDPAAGERTQKSRVHCANALQLLHKDSALSGQAPFDLILLDPPFRQHWPERLLPLLDAHWLSAQAQIYLEQEVESPYNPLQDLPEGFRLHRSKQAGQVCYQLFQR